MSSRRAARLRSRLLVLGCVALAACAGVLGLGRTGTQPFSHRKHATAGVTCVTCHTGVEAGTALHLPDAASCLTCHARPHDPGPCLSCHTAPNAIAELTEARAHLVFEHKTHAAASRGNCMRCHIGVTARRRAACDSSS